METLNLPASKPNHRNIWKLIFSFVHLLKQWKYLFAKIKTKKAMYNNCLRTRRVVRRCEALIMYATVGPLYFPVWGLALCAEPRTGFLDWLGLIHWLESSSLGLCRGSGAGPHAWQFGREIWAGFWGGVDQLGYFVGFLQSFANFIRFPPAIPFLGFTGGPAVLRWQQWGQVMVFGLRGEN